MDWGIFFKYVGLTALGIVLFLTLLYWIRVGFKKLFPNFKYWFKYKVRRKKFKPEVVEMLSEDIKNGVRKEDMVKTILVGGYGSVEQANEISYIYEKLQGRYMKNE